MLALHKVDASDVVALYREHLAKRGFVSDAAQWRAVGRLQRLYQEWTAYKARRNTALKRLIVKPPLPKGVYLWGGVGRGKSSHGQLLPVRAAGTEAARAFPPIHARDPQGLDEMKEDPLARSPHRQALAPHLLR